MTPERTQGGALTSLLPTTRLEAFSDGVFAIAITLLVLELHVPTDPEGLLRELAAEWPGYLGYFVSFAFIGGVWIAHSHVTRFIKATDAALLRLNLVLLLFVSFLPFTTSLLANHLTTPAARRGHDLRHQPDARLADGQRAHRLLGRTEGGPPTTPPRTSSWPSRRSGGSRSCFKPWPPRSASSSPRRRHHLPRHLSARSSPTLCGGQASAAGGESVVRDCPDRGGLRQGDIEPSRRGARGTPHGGPGLLSRLV